MPSIRARASWMSASVGTVCVATYSLPRMVLVFVLHESRNPRMRLSCFTSKFITFDTAHPHATSKTNVTTAAIAIRNLPSRSVAHLEHAFHDLANRAQRVELASLYLFQQPPQLGIVLHRAHEVS